MTSKGILDFMWIPEKKVNMGILEYHCKGQNYLMEDCQWQILDRQLKHHRMNSIAIMIPDSLANILCQQNPENSTTSFRSGDKEVRAPLQASSPDCNLSGTTRPIQCLSDDMIGAHYAHQALSHGLREAMKFLKLNDLGILKLVVSMDRSSLYEVLKIL